MGKCGARELNYVSDVDVIFVARGGRRGRHPGGRRDDAVRRRTRSARSTRRCGPRASTARWCARWTPTSPTTSAGPRPGSSRRCSRRGRSPATPSSGEQYIDALMPMVWTAVRARGLRGRGAGDAPAGRGTVPAGARARELKLGTGGLRDVEFAVQLLQLVHGRTDESLHVASTVDALAALGAGGYVGRDDAANLTASYGFLRLLEHRLQLQRLSAPTCCPTSRRRRGAALAGARGPHAARRSARRARGAARGAQAPEHAGVAAAREAVLPAAAGIGWPVGMFGAHDARGRRTPARRTGLRGPAERADPPGGADQGSSGRRGRVQQVLLPALLDWLSDTPDPDAGLLAYRRISEALADQRWYLRRCATRARWPSG